MNFREIVGRGRSEDMKKQMIRCWRWWVTCLSVCLLSVTLFVFCQPYQLRIFAWFYVRNIVHFSKA